MTKQNLIIAFIIGLFVVEVFTVQFAPPTASMTAIRAGLFAIGQLIAIIGGIYSMKKYGSNNKTGKTLGIFILGLIFWMVGGLIFAVIDFYHGQSEFPSIADATILVGYGFLLVALINEIKSRKVTLTKMHILIMAIGAIITTIIVFYFNIFLVFDPTTPLFVLIATIVYSFADIFLMTTIILVLIMAYEYSGGKLFFPWFNLFLGALCMLIADGLFDIFITDYLSKTGQYTIINIIWRLAHVFFAIGLFKFGFVISNIQSKVIADTNSNFIPKSEIQKSPATDTKN